MMTKQRFSRTTILWSFALLLMGFFTSCSHTSKGNRFATDSLRFDTTLKVGQCKVSCILEADYPKDAKLPLSKSVSEWINENMETEYAGDLADGHKMILTSGKVLTDTLMSEAKMVGSGETPFEFTREVSLRKGYETDKLVTYLYQFSSYDGGAHGSACQAGATFRKSDGRKMGWDMFTRFKVYELQDLIKEGLKSYFKVKSDNQLRENLLNPEQVYFLPFPQTAPYFTKDGLFFVYQQYEIACYAAGMPSFTIPYDKIKDKLTYAAADLLK